MYKITMDNYHRNELNASQSSLNSTDSSSSTGNNINLSDSEEINNNTTHPIELKRLRRMFHHSVPTVCRTTECRNLLNYLRDFSSSFSDGQKLPDITYSLDNDHCIRFFRNYIIYMTLNCREMLSNISQRQYLNFIRLSMSLWNLTDKYESLCARMATNDIHVYLIKFLVEVHISKEMLQSTQIQTMILSVVGNLHNINNKLQYTRTRYRQEHLIECLMPLAALEITGNLIGIKTAALLLLAVLVDENENSSLNANDDHIIYILDILNRTLGSPGHFSKYYGYHTLEILLSLRYIASPDANKKRLINNGVLGPIEVVLRQDCSDSNLDEVVAGLELLWSLSFTNECLQAFDDDGGYLKCRVETLTKSDNQNVVLSARGILWNIDQQRTINIKNLILQEAMTPNVNGHIMISYQHRTQETMIKIKDALVDSQYKVWMDVDHMRGDFVDAMAEGIQHASVLVLGMCQAFKDSPHCRQEVKYAYTLGIPLIPVILEQGFTPDGWLGLMCATLSYTNFFEPSTFDINQAQLEERLGSLGKVCNGAPMNNDCSNGHNPSSSNVSNGLQAVEEQISKEQANGSFDRSDSYLLKSLKSDLHSLPKSRNPITFKALLDDPSSSSKNSEEVSILAPQSRSGVVSWTTLQCLSWLTDNGIDPTSHDSPLSLLNGPLLYELAEMRVTAPHSYFSTAKEELKLNIIENLRLSHALRKLVELP